MFKEILQDILTIKPTSTAVLLEHYRNHPIEKAVKYLAALSLFEQDQKIDEQGVEKELRDGFDNLLASARKEAYFQSLVEKRNKD